MIKWGWLASCSEVNMFVTISIGCSTYLVEIVSQQDVYSRGIIKSHPSPPVFTNISLEWKTESLWLRWQIGWGCSLATFVSGGHEWLAYRTETVPANVWIRLMSKRNVFMSLWLIWLHCQFSSTQHRPVIVLLRNCPYFLRGHGVGCLSMWDLISVAVLHGQF